MNSVNDALRGTRSAVNSVIASAEASGASWVVPRAPGKWSPAQIVEHVARSLEESAKEVAGVPSKFPTFPSLVRPLVRTFFFSRVLKNQAFPKARTTKPMNPSHGPDTPAAGRVRLEDACQRFERECRSASERGSLMTSGLFGSVSIVDYVRFQELHTLHHLRQMGESAPARR
ncbi:MAG: DinB family protein [Longimicrobiales bacterium]